MSTERPTLSDFTQKKTPAERQQERIDERREEILEEGGNYGRYATGSEPDTSPKAVCLCCGRDLTAATARVVGDNEGNVRACDQCWTSVGGEDYHGVVTAVHHFRAGDGRRKSKYGGETQ